MAPPPVLYRAVRLVNLVVFAVGVAMLADHSATAARGSAVGPVHWPAGQRELTVVDRTGDLGWERATRHAVEQWAAASELTGIRVGWQKGEGNCRAEGTRVHVCQTAQGALGTAPGSGREALTRTVSNRGHAVAAVILVCGNCIIDEARMRVVATHEVGHALGLSHTFRPSSVMFPTGSGDAPDRADLEALRDLYSHPDTPPRCAYFNLRLGGFCV